MINPNHQQKIRIRANINPDDVVLDIVPADHDHVLDTPAERARAQAIEELKAKALIEEARAKAMEEEARAKEEQEAQQETTNLAREIKRERAERMRQLCEGIKRVYSKDFNKRITTDHQKQMKDLIDERSKLDEKTIVLRDKCFGLTTPLITYIMGIVTLYVMVNVAMSANFIGLLRMLTLSPFIYLLIYLLNYCKRTLIAQLHTMKEERTLIQNKRHELIRKMNQLRCSIDSVAFQEKTNDKMKIPEGEQVAIPDNVKSTQKINEEAAGDNFHMDCEKISAILPESYLETMKDKIDETFLSGILILVVLGLLFLAHAFIYYLIPGSGPAPPPVPPSLHR